MSKKFYATSTVSRPGGKGYYEVTAKDESHARDIVFNHIGSNWSFMYASLEDVHPFDRILICKLGETMTKTNDTYNGV